MYGREGLVVVKNFRAKKTIDVFQKWDDVDERWVAGGRFPGVSEGLIN